MAADVAAAGTTYSCVANYEGTNVEISASYYVLLLGCSRELTNSMQLPMSKEALLRLPLSPSPMKSV